MDDERNVTNNYNLADVGVSVLLIFMLIAGILAVLFFMAGKGSILAIGILVALATVTLIFLGVFISLLVMGRVHSHEEKRARAEQARFRDNTKENLATMELQARAQLAQAKSQEQQWRVMRQEIDASRQIAAPADNGSDGGFVFDQSLFEELEN